jgi:hypothetical protein
LRFALLLEIARLEIDLHGLEPLPVVVGRAQRLAFRQEEIARESVAHAHDFAHLAELGHAFQQDHFHRSSPLNARFRFV